MTTKHMNAAPGDFAEVCLMPGDPRRARFIAERFFSGARRVTDVRNMWGYTGEYEGLPVSVMAHGMGIPSASIYCTELIRDYGVRTVIRVGSCGTTHPDVSLRDIVIGMGASTDSGVNRMRIGGYDLAALASWRLVRNAAATAADLGLKYHVGGLFSADLFYTADAAILETAARYGVLGIEMEAAGIYPVAAEYGAEALAICTVSDDIGSGEALSSDERETGFGDMIRLALEAALRST